MLKQAKLRKEKNEKFGLVKKEEKGYTAIRKNSPKKGQEDIERAGLAFLFVLFQLPR